MCFGTPVYNTTSKSELPAFLEDAYKKMTEQALAVTDPSVQYQPYGGQRLAPLDTQQQAARQMANQNAQAYQPDLNTARGLTSLSTAPITGQDINYYMNPYQNQVTSNVLDEMRRRSDIDGQKMSDSAVRSGAFGGSRYGIQEEERMRNLSQQQSTTASQLAQQNYQQALGAAQSQKAQQLSGAGAYGNIAGQQMALGQQGIEGLNQAGLQGQTQLQRGMDMAYGDFQKQQQFPYTQASTLGNLLSGVPGAQMATTYGSQPGPSMAQQLAGLGGVALGAYGQYSSDLRLKEDIKLIGKSPSNINIYSFKYKDKEGKYEGVMAQEVPWASFEGQDGYLMVDYSKVDVGFRRLN
tara:strand:+ start:4759 stop:5814 length:1056 start_codon:yes stop_codon:yes gene_type:complete